MKKLLKTFGLPEYVVAVVGLAAVLSGVKAGLLMSVVQDQHVPLIQLTGKLKFKANSAYLWFDRAMHGDPAVAVDRRVFSELDQGLALCAALLEERGSDISRVLKATRGESYRVRFQTLCDQFQLFKALTVARWSGLRGGDSSFQVDQAYEAVFARIMGLTKNLEDVADGIIVADHRALDRWSRLFGAFFAALFVGTAVMVVRNQRTLGRKNADLEARMLELSHQVMERKRAEAALKEAKENLELIVAERTLELSKSNDLLQGEVNERKHAEEALQHQAEELSRSNKELEQFAYVASHDLQEPLRMVASYTQLLAKKYRGKLDDDADEFIGYAVDGAMRMQKLITDLLAYSRVGTRGGEFVAADAGEVLDQVLSDLKVRIEETGAVITRDPLPTVTADARQLHQLLQNLISNGIKFSDRPPPRIHVSAQRRGKDWLFSVGDRGIGIDPQYAQRIFVIFQRLHHSKEYPGTGIGLAICKKIVERHGGRIWMESRPGEGSTFYFTLPVQRGGRK